MYYNKEEIAAYLKTFAQYGLNDLGYFTEDDVDRFISSIGYEPVPNFDYDAGATKLTIIPENRDYVIKIPFNGEWRYGDCFSFQGADSAYFDNYCEAEMNIYQEVKENGWEDMFLPLEYVGDFANYPIYVQQKIELLERNSIEQKNYSSKESKDKVNKDYQYNRIGNLPSFWTASCLEVLGGSIEKLRKFISFLYDTGIGSDLHSANVGFLNGKAIILDYGGYFEQGGDSDVSC